MDFAGGQSVQMPSESDMMHQVKAELATAYAQEFYNVSTKIAFCRPAGSCSRTELNSSPIFLFVCLASPDCEGQVLQGVRHEPELKPEQQREDVPGALR